MVIIKVTANAPILTMVPQTIIPKLNPSFSFFINQNLVRIKFLVYLVVAKNKILVSRFSRPLYACPVIRTYPDLIVLFYIGECIIHSIYGETIYTNSIKSGHTDQEFARHLTRFSRMSGPIYFTNTLFTINYEKGTTTFSDMTFR